MCCCPQSLQVKNSKKAVKRHQDKKCAKVKNRYKNAREQKKRRNVSDWKSKKNDGKKDDDVTVSEAAAASPTITFEIIMNV